MSPDIHIQGTWSKIKKHPLRDGNTKLIKFYDMTNFDKEIIDEWVKAFVSAVITFILFLLMCAMCGCKTQYVPFETVRTEYKEADTTAIYNRLLRIVDSMRHKESQSDSVVDSSKEMVVVNLQGDTVKVEKTRYVYLSSRHEKELEQKVNEQDSVIQFLRAQLTSIKSDSVPVPYPVERELSKWEQTKMCVGGLTVMAFILVSGFTVIYLLARKFRKQLHD